MQFYEFFLLTGFLAFLANGSRVPEFPSWYKKKVSFTQQCPPPPTPRIMHGSTTPPFQIATWHASLHIALREGEVVPVDNNDGSAQCSGVIVNSRIVLTSGHCLLYAKSNGWLVYVGFDGETPINQGTAYTVSHTKIYDPYLTSKTPENDFGLIYFTDPMHIDSKVTIVQLAAVSASLLDRNYWTSCQLSGTGQDTDKDMCVGSMKKQYMSAYLIGKSCCEPMLRNEGDPPFPETALCYRNLSSMGCQGDSGAGLSCIDPFKQRKVIAIHSGGRRCCDINNQVISSPQEKRLSPLDTAVYNWIQARILAYDTEFPARQG